MSCCKLAGDYLYKLPPRNVPRWSPLIHYLAFLQTPRIPILPKNCHLSASIFVRCTKNTGHLGNHVGSLLSTEPAGSSLSRIFSKSPNSSSLAELKLHPRMVEGAKKIVKERTCKLNGTISSSLDQAFQLLIDCGLELMKIYLKEVSTIGRWILFTDYASLSLLLTT